MGVLSDIIRPRTKAKQSGGTFYPNVSKNHKIQSIFTATTNKFSFFEYWRRSSSACSW